MPARPISSRLAANSSRIRPSIASRPAGAGGDGGHHHVGAPGERLGERGGRPVEGDMQHLRPRARQEVHHAEMGGAAHAPGRVGERARPLLRGCDDRREARPARMRDEQEERRAEQRHMLEIGQRIEADRAQRVRGGGEGDIGAEQQCVPIGPRPRGMARGDGGGGAGLVVHDEGAAEARAEPVQQQVRHDAGRPPGGVGDGDRDGLRPGPGGLGADRGRGRGGGGAEEKGAAGDADHRRLLPGPRAVARGAALLVGGTGGRPCGRGPGRCGR